MYRNCSNLYFVPEGLTSGLVIPAKAEKLRSTLSLNVKGNSEVVKTPLGKRYGLKLLEEWDDILQSHGGEVPKGLMDYEQEMREKVGPLSVRASLLERLPSIQDYFSNVLLPSTDILPEAEDSVLKEWACDGSMRMRSLTNTLSNMKLSTAAGLPLMGKRRDSVREVERMHITKEGTVYKGRVYPHTAILGWRGQEGGPLPEDVKQRVVFMFPFQVNAHELMVYQPIIEYAQLRELVPAWKSLGSVDMRMTGLFRTKRPEDYIICTDFSKFDQHFNRKMQECAKTLISHMLTRGGPAEEWIDVVFPIKYNISLLCSNNVIARGAHGMGSGSGGTNCDETLVHRALQHESAIVSGTQLNPYSQCLGDDGVISYDNINVDKVLEHYTSHGLEMNATKQFVDREQAVYLRRWYSKDYMINGINRGVYSTFRALGRLLFQERYYDDEFWNAKMVILRELSILENLEWHPLRDQFADFILKKDQYDLGLRIPNFFDNLGNLAAQATDYKEDFLGYVRSNMERTSINDWWIVKYLKSKL